jgi:hypothetical protein
VDGSIVNVFQIKLSENGSNHQTASVQSLKLIPEIFRKPMHLFHRIDQTIMHNQSTLIIIASSGWRAIMQMKWGMRIFHHHHHSVHDDHI